MIPTFARSAALVEARMQAHRAAQVVSALGTTVLPHLPDYGETNLGWDPERQALMGRSVGGVCAGLRVADLTWLVAGPRPAERSAVGATVAEGMRWLHSVAVASGVPDRPLERSPYDDPPPELDDPTPLRMVEGLDEIAAWFHVASLAVGRTAELEGGTAVRCWPHHFDLATLLAAGHGTVGVGMCAGDGGIAEPYFYVTPTPRPEPGEGPARLPTGAWNKQGWFGAVLRGSEIPSNEPRATVDVFLDAAVAACRAMVDGSRPRS